jgi:prepilin-type N-terminal cleavage/methylation domain-containing protein
MNRRGITLMELLVAITLFSLLSVGILYAFRIGLNAMTNTNSRLMSNRRVLGAERILAQQIAGFMPTRADCRVGPQGPQQQLPFFQGEPQTMRFVSTYSLQEALRGYPRILEFQVMPGAEGRGVRLVVNEHLYTGPLSTGRLCAGVLPDPATGATAILFQPVAIGPGSFVLADKLAHCSFGYREEVDAGGTQQAIWRPRWIKDIPPLAVRIDMAPLEHNPGRLQVSSMVAPIHVNRSPLVGYSDWQ